MIKVGLISDTHGYMDDNIISYLENCDEIWHAGDIGDISVMDRLNDLNKTIRAVYGNIDDHDCRLTYPLDQLFIIESVKVYITHIGGYPGRLKSRVNQFITQNKPDLYICGHSHICKVMPDNKHNLLHMNPGSCGHYGFHKIRTIILFDIEKERVKNLRVVELGNRGVRQ